MGYPETIKEEMIFLAWIAVTWKCHSGRSSLMGCYAALVAEPGLMNWEMQLGKVKLSLGPTVHRLGRYQELLPNRGAT